MRRTKAFIVRTETRIAPFDDRASETLVVQKPLRERQLEVLAELGLEAQAAASVEDVPRHERPCLVFTDDLYFNSDALSRFLRLARAAPNSTRCVLPKTTAFARLFTPAKDDDSTDDLIRLPLYFLKEADPQDAADVELDVGERPVPFYVPPHMRGADELVLPACLRPVMRLRHAPDILLANIAHLHTRFARLLHSPARRALLALRARSLQPARALARMNRIGRRADIHPTAYLEGAEIGDDCQIGANAVIRMSSVGDRCQIGDGSVVKHSVVGDGSVLYDDLTLGFAVCYPETFLIHGPYHLSVFGRSSAMFATILDDFRLDRKPIRLEIDGEYVPHPFPFIGSFIGHRTRVAGGAIISPGRSIPNDLLIFPSPGAVLTRLRRDLPRDVPLFIQDGELRELYDDGRAGRAHPPATPEVENHDDEKPASRRFANANANVEERI